LEAGSGHDWLLDLKVFLLAQRGLERFSDFADKI
jgi:hypothetical protein